MTGTRQLLCFLIFFWVFEIRLLIKFDFEVNMSTSDTQDYIAPIDKHSVFDSKEIKRPPLPDVPEVSANDVDKENFYRQSIEAKKLELMELSPNEASKRRVFIMRHGERMDFVFGSWVPFCYNEAGAYNRKDLNMPRTLPERDGGGPAYRLDSPLTNIGLFEATLVGQALRDANINVDQAYCSPSYRCVQTADAVLKELNKRDEIPIKIEPGLFEWISWYPQEFIPKWMTPRELTKAGFNIDLNYIPLIDEQELKQSKETCELFYLRNALVTRNALTANPKGNILLVGHTSTLETCSRELVGKSIRSGRELMEIITKVPYCSLVEVTGSGNDWEIVEPPCLPPTHSTSERFDWKILL